MTRLHPCHRCGEPCDCADDLTGSDANLEAEECTECSDCDYDDEDDDE